MGIWAAMPPMAWAPRRWQVWISRSTYERKKVAVHGDQGAVRQHEARLVAELLDEAEDVVPAAAVQSGRVLAKFPEDLVHFEGGEDGFDEHRRADGAARNPELLLRQKENVIPQAGFQVALHFRQVEIRARAVGDQRLGVVEEEQAEIEERGGDGLAIHQEVFFHQVPAARADHQDGRVLAEFVALPLGAGVGDGRRARRRAD